MRETDERGDAAIDPGTDSTADPERFTAAIARGEALPRNGALDTFRALAHPARLDLLGELLHGERSVSELATAAGLRQPAASLHLARLRSGGLVLRRSESRQVFYALSRDPTMRLLVRIACGPRAADIARERRPERSADGR